MRPPPKPRPSSSSRAPRHPPPSSAPPSAGSSSPPTNPPRLVSEAPPPCRGDHISLHVAHLVDCFGRGRLIGGSDWPVVASAGGYEKCWPGTDTLLAGLEDGQRSLIPGLNPVEFYGLDAK